MKTVSLTVVFDTERDEDGQYDDRTIAEVLEYPGVMCYGASKLDAYAKVVKLLGDVLKAQCEVVTTSTSAK